MDFKHFCSKINIFVAIFPPHSVLKYPPVRLESQGMAGILASFSIMVGCQQSIRPAFDHCAALPSMLVCWWAVAGTKSHPVSTDSSPRPAHGRGWWLTKVLCARCLFLCGLAPRMTSLFCWVLSPINMTEQVSLGCSPRIQLSTPDTDLAKSVVRPRRQPREPSGCEMEVFLAGSWRCVARRWSGKAGRLTKTGLQRLGVVPVLHPLWQEHRGHAVWPASKIRK